MSIFYDLIQYGDGSVDKRLPKIAKQEKLIHFLSKKDRYINPFFLYWDPYPINFSHRIICDFNIDYNHDLLEDFSASQTLLHAVKKINILANKSITINCGSILIGEEILLKAPRIQILDNEQKSPIRTTIVAIDRLTIETNQLIIDGADIMVPEKIDFKIKEYGFANLKENSRWLLEKYPCG